MRVDFTKFRPLLVLLVFSVLSTAAYSQVLNKREKIILEKNFYFLSLIYKDPGFFARDRPPIRPSTSYKSLEELAATFYLSASQNEKICAKLRSWYLHSRKFRKMVKKVKASGYYNAVRADTDTAFLRQVWTQSASGINHIIDVYLKGKKPRYPTIDSISFDIRDSGFIKSANQLAKNTAALHPKHYWLPVIFSIKLLMLNHRDEAARFEPLQSGMNATAFKKIKTIPWNRYPYAAILVPGFGPRKAGVRLDSIAINRCLDAVKRYRSGKAPFIIVSGGHVSPNHTPFAEAVEMKKYLVNVLDIPESAVLIEPHARHTTTNLRNANRMIYRFKIPEDKPLLIVTDASQSRYITGSMGNKAMTELGYKPFENIKAISPTETSYYPNKLSLQSNPQDPLDP